MRTRILVFALILFTTTTQAARHATSEVAPPAQRIPLDGAVATLAFSPNGDATRVVVDAIERAKREILVQAYSFTSVPIAKALVRAHERGVDVRAILDRTNETGRYSGATYLEHAGIPVYIDDTVAIAHNKVMVIDGEAVVTGSFNFTSAAQERNAENVIVIDHAPELARAYARNWAWRLSLSRPYRGR